ncbi:nesprin-2a [Oryzias melastigma]|uniref:nesprin-2a n=1 Tax=Oryzias melastigma TaxID=30732 RepID=UPI00168D3ADE|nr:nesprin-2a [Oryzias melastigma]
MVNQAVTTVKGTMERVATAWKTYNKHLAVLHLQVQSPVEEGEGMNEWTSRHAQLNEAGNFLIEATETSTSFVLTEQLSKVNKSWAERMKKTVFEVPSETRVMSLQALSSMIQEASLLVRKPVEVASVPLKDNIQKLQVSIVDELEEISGSCV